MAKDKRIGLELLDDTLKILINASAKIIPVEYAFVESGTNPNNYEFVIIVSEGINKNNIYRWDNGWELIGANDTNIDWSDVKNPPTEYNPAPHTHNYSPLGHTHDYSPSTHKHDGDYSKLGHEHDYSPSTHNHDETYSKLSHEHDYSPSNHNHDEVYLDKGKETVILDLEQRMYDIENGYTEGHSHDNRAILDLLTDDGGLRYNNVGVSFDTHNHDGAYYKKSEVESKLSSKSDRNHNHDTLYANKSHETDEVLHLSTEQINKIETSSSISVSETEPTTDFWYKII